MKKKMVLMGIAGVLVMTAIISGTLAGFTTQSGQGKTDITTKQLGIELDGDNIAADIDRETISTLMPGGTAQVPYAVTNNIEDGYELYTRVTIYKSWDKEGLAADKIHLYIKNEQGEDTELLSGTQINNWFVQYADDEQIIMYYASPLSEQQVTGNVLDSLKVEETLTNEYTDTAILLEVKADAVQKAVAESSIPAEWGVYPVFDADGNIVAIEE